jgi:hypothetical protein
MNAMKLVKLARGGGNPTELLKGLGGFASSKLSPNAKIAIKGLIEQLNTPQGFTALEEISLLAGPEGPPIAAAVKAAVTAAKMAFYVAMCCCVISTIICFSTFVASFTAKDEKKKSSLKGTWIAFLVLCSCMAMLALFFHMNSSLSRIVLRTMKKFDLNLNA